MRRISRYFIGILALLLFPYTIFAQVLGIEDAVNATLSNYPSLSAAQSALEVVRENARVVKDNRLPNLRLHDQINIGTANGLSGSYFSMGIIVPTSGGRCPENSSDLASGHIALAAADWEVVNSGRFRAEDQLALADIVAVEAAVENEKFAISQNVIDTLRNGTCI